MVGGYIFWLVMARITTPEIIGASSSVVSLATIFMTIVAMAIPSGLPRLLGKSFAEENIGEAKALVKASFLLITIAVIICSSVILAAQNLIYGFFKIDSKLVVISVFLMIAFTTTLLLRAVITSTLKTKMLPVSMAVSTAVKLGFAIILVLVGMGAIGITLGYLFFEVASSILLAGTIFLVLRKPSVSQVGLLTASNRIFRTSVVSWVPALVYNIGTQLGTLVVLGSHGAGQAGVFFVAFAIVTAISGVMGALMNIAFPVLSALVDGRKNLAWRVTKLSLILAVPFSCSLIFYSKDIMSLFGLGYASGSSTLEIMLFVMLPSGVGTGISTLMYAYGKYKQVLYLGIASNISRTVLYFVLVPAYGSDGAAMSFALGTVISFVVSIFYARQVKFLIFWKDLSLLFFVPLALSFILHHFGIYFIAGIVSTLAISYLVLLKTRIINREDLKDALEILPNSVSIPLLKTFDNITRRFSQS